MQIPQVDNQIIYTSENGEMICITTDHENAMEFLEFRLLVAMVTIEKAED